METDPSDGSVKIATIPAKRLEFVFNNGDNDWDSPGRYQDGPKNYEAKEPGTYRVKSGRMERQ